MTYTSQQYNANYFSGANITISMGPCILTQAFGIEASVEQTKRPIYGYNSQYFDAVAKGLVLVNGRLYINFISPRYLTVTIHRFHQVMNAWTVALRNNDPDTLAEYLRTSSAGASLFSAIHRQLHIPMDIFPLQDGEEFPGEGGQEYTVDFGDSQYNISPETAFHSETFQPTFADLLDDFFESDAEVEGLQRIMWGNNSSFISDADLGGTSRRMMSINSDLENQYSIANISNRSDNAIDRVSSFVRPDQIGHPIDLKKGVDITITYGQPFGDPVTSTSFHYDHSTSRVIEGVHFIGESFQIFANNEPIMDVYPFIARNTHAISVPSPMNEPVTTSNTQQNWLESTPSPPDPTYGPVDLPNHVI